MQTDPLFSAPPEAKVDDEITLYGFGGIPVLGSPTPIAVDRPEEYSPTSTLTEKISEIPGGLLQGAIEATPGALGLGTGLVLGMKAAPFTGIFAPLTVVVGGGVGFTAGLMAEDVTSALIDKFDIFSDPTKEDRAPFREGAKTAGGAIPFAGGMRFLPEQIDNWTSRLVSSLGRSARESPKLFYTVEAMGATGSGTGGGVAEAYYPGNPLAKFAFEFGGGAFFPFRAVVSNFGEAKNLSTAVKGLFGEERAINKAAKRLQDIFSDPYIVETFKEDPNKILQELRAPGLVSEIPTAAQKSGSAVLSAFEASLARQNAQFGGDIESQGKAYMLAHKELVNLLTQTQDPEALVKAAQFQSDYFRDLISMRMKIAQSKIDPVLKGLTPDTPEYKAALGENLYKAVSGAVEDVRKFETDLYKKAERAGFRELTNADLKRLGVPKEKWAETRALMVAPKQGKASSLVYEALSRLENSFIGGLSNEKVYNTDVLSSLKSLGLSEDLISTYNGGLLSKQYRETDVLPPEIKRLIDKKIQKITPGQLQKFRSELLGLARKARAGAEKGDADAYGSLAQAALEDLQSFKIPEYEEAIAFSRVLNDHFTRAFPAEITASKRSGANKNAPELLVDQFFETVRRGGDRTALRMAEVEDAVEFAAWAKVVDNPKDAVSVRAEWVNAVRDGDEAAIKRLKPLADQVRQTSYVLSVDDAFKKIFEQDVQKLFSRATFGDGRSERSAFNVDAYRAFLNQNDAVLQRFNPTLHSELQNVNKAEEYFRFVLDETSALNRNLRDQAAFSAVLKSPENITRVVSTALSSGNPVTQVQRLMDLTKNKKVLEQAGLGDAPRRGLSSSFYDWAFNKASPEGADARGNTPAFDAVAFRSAMFGEIKPGQPSLSQMMVKNGLADTGEMVRLKKIVDTIEKTQKAMSSGRYVQTLSAINPLEDLAIRLAGTRAVEPLTPKGPGALVASGAGVRAFKKLFEDMPMGKTRHMLERVAKDPEFAASLLEKGQANKQGSFFSVGKRVLQSFERNGITPLSVATTNYFNQSAPPTDEEIEERLITPVTGPTAAQMLQQVSPPKAARVGPPTRGVPGFTAQAPSRSPKVGGAPATSQSRAMFESLFPTDTISPLIGQPR